MGTITTSANLAWHQRGALGPIGDFSRRVVEAIDPTGLVSATHLRRGEPTPVGTAANLGTGVGIVAGVVIPGGGPLRGLKLLHKTLSISTLKYLGRQNTDDIIRSLAPGAKSPLTVKVNGTIMQGNHRIHVLQQRGVDVNSLPRVPYP